MPKSGPSRAMDLGSWALLISVVGIGLFLGSIVLALVLFVWGISVSASFGTGSRRGYGWIAPLRPDAGQRSISGPCAIEKPTALGTDHPRLDTESPSNKRVPRVEIKVQLRFAWVRNANARGRDERLFFKEHAPVWVHGR